EGVENGKGGGVGWEAASSLSKIRPVSATAGQALEQAAAKDPAMRVRMQAWTSLRFYHLAGYRAGGKDAQEFQVQVLKDGGGKGPPVVDNEVRIVVPPLPGKGPAAPPLAIPGAAKGTYPSGMDIPRP